MLCLASGFICVSLYRIACLYLWRPNALQIPWPKNVREVAREEGDVMFVVAKSCNPDCVEADDAIYTVMPLPDALSIMDALRTKGGEPNGQ